MKFVTSSIETKNNLRLILMIFSVFFILLDTQFILAETPELHCQNNAGIMIGKGNTATGCELLGIDYLLSTAGNSTGMYYTAQCTIKYCKGGTFKVKNITYQTSPGQTNAPCPATTYDICSTSSSFYGQF